MTQKTIFQSVAQFAQNLDQGLKQYEDELKKNDPAYQNQVLQSRISFLWIFLFVVLSCIIGERIWNHFHTKKQGRNVQNQISNIRKQMRKRQEIQNNRYQEHQNLIDTMRKDLTQMKRDFKALRRQYSDVYGQNKKSQYQPNTLFNDDANAQIQGRPNEGNGQVNRTPQSAQTLFR